MNVFEFILALLGIGFVATVIIVVLAFFGIRKLVRWIRRGRSSTSDSFQPLDQEAGASPDDIYAVLKRYAHERTIGSRARAAMDQVKSTTEKQAHLMSLLSGKFTEESLSWAKFSSAVETACHALICNCTFLANRIQAFDLRDYRELERTRSTMSLKQSAAPGDVQIERWNLLNGSLREMDDVISANEQMLLELDRFSAELGRQGQLEATSSANEILNEIQELSEQAKLYR